MVDAYETAKLFIDHIYRHHGLPDVIISDRDKIFMSRFWKALFKMLGTKLSTSSAYHPQTDGQTEVMNRKLEEMIRAFINYKQDNWDEHLTEFEVAYNSSVNSTTTFTPFFLAYGMHPRTIPFETVASKNETTNDYLTTMQEATAIAQQKIKRANENSAKYENKKRNPCLFKVGDLVMLSTKNLHLDTNAQRNKLSMKYCGPFEIIEAINPVTFRLDLSQPMKTRGIHNAFHCSLLAPYVKDKLFKRTCKPPLPLKFEDEHEEYEVEKILNHRGRKSRTEYLVKWLGYPDHENSWVSSKDMGNAQELLKEYHQSL